MPQADSDVVPEPGVCFTDPDADHVPQVDMVFDSDPDCPAALALKRIKGLEPGIDHIRNVRKFLESAPRAVLILEGDADTSAFRAAEFALSPAADTDKAECATTTSSRTASLSSRACPALFYLVEGTWTDLSTQDLPETPPEPIRPAAGDSDPWSVNDLWVTPFSLYRISVTRSGQPGQLPFVLSADARFRIAVLLNFAALPDLRDYLIRFIDGILATLRLALVQLRVALARRLDVTSFVLLLVATFRRYGRRGESDDELLPAHRCPSVIGGEPARRY